MLPKPTAKPKLERKNSQWLSQAALSVSTLTSEASEVTSAADKVAELLLDLPFSLIVGCVRLSAIETALNPRRPTFSAPRQWRVRAINVVIRFLIVAVKKELHPEHALLRTNGLREAGLGGGEMLLR